MVSKGLPSSRLLEGARTSFLTKTMTLFERLGRPLIPHPHSCRPCSFPFRKEALTFPNYPSLRKYSPLKETRFVSLLLFPELRDRFGVLSGAGKQGNSGGEEGPSEPAVSQSLSPMLSSRSSTHTPVVTPPPAGCHHPRLTDQSRVPQ